LQGAKIEDHRRKWDRAEYEKLAIERKLDERQAMEEKERKKKEPPVQRELLKPRDYRVCNLHI
jgi:U4/U6.U5 tri-snRNP component SNU23